MKSSKDIEPRVGMQVVFSNHKRVERIVKVDNRLSFMCGKITLDSGNTAYSWEHGSFSIEWIPPTDEERKMFIDNVPNLDGPSNQSFFDWFHSEMMGYFYCHAAFRNTECYMEQRHVSVSLALDGADYDNMPEGFE